MKTLAGDLCKRRQLFETNDGIDEVFYNSFTMRFVRASLGSHTGCCGMRCFLGTGKARASAA